MKKISNLLLNLIVKALPTKSSFCCSAARPKMANHVRSPVSVSIPEAVTLDGVTVYKIHVSHILKPTRLFFGMYVRCIQS